MRYFLPLFLLIFVSCQTFHDYWFEEENEADHNQQVSFQSQEAHQSSNATQSRKRSLKEVVEAVIVDPYEIKGEGAVLLLKVKNQKTYSALSFEDFLLKLAQSFSAQSQFKVVAIEARGDDDVIFKARFYLQDVESHLKGEISQPELIRRLQIEVVETIASLQTQIKKMRDQGLHTEAQVALQKLIQLDPQSFVAQFILGNVLKDQGKYWEAIEVYNDLIKKGQFQKEASHNLGVCYEKVGSFEDSINSYKMALEIDPNDHLLMRQLAQVYRQNKDYNGTLFWLGKARSIKDTSDLWMIEGNLYRDQKMYSKAYEAYQKALALNPNDHRILFNMVLIDLDSKKFDQAKEKYVQLQQDDPVLALELSNVSVFQ